MSTPGCTRLHLQQNQIMHKIVESGISLLMCNKNMNGTFFISSFLQWSNFHLHNRFSTEMNLGIPFTIVKSTTVGSSIFKTKYKKD